MSISPLDMLKRLGSGVRPDGPGPSAPAGTPAPDAGAFSDLLAKVRAGQVSSGRRVECPAGCGVELTDDQLDRLSVVADAAEAAGAWRMVASIDGKSVVVDVEQRQVLGTADDGIVTGVDAVVTVPQGSPEELRRLFAGGSAGESVTARASGGAMNIGVRNQSVAELLSSLDRGRAGSNGEGSTAAA